MKNIFTLPVFLLAGIASALAQPTQPPAPAACNSGNCTQPVSETCAPVSSSVVSDFRNGSLFSGSALAVGSVYRFGNIASVNGRQVNATVTVDAIFQATLNSIDDDGATDQNGNSVTGFFGPRIGPDQNLAGSDRRGYVQFTIRFYKHVDNPLSNNDFDSIAILNGLNYIHYDIDGSEAGNGGWFRETGLVKSVGGMSINGDASTELVSYSYPDGGFNWNGFAGSVCERTGLSRCAQVTAAAAFAAPQTEITIRMGYDYNRTNSNFNSQPVRQYGSRFGCFSFPTTVTLPVRLNGFSGYYNNNGSARLLWQTEQELNFSHFELERSYNGAGFNTAAVIFGRGLSSLSQYQYNDAQTGGPVVYYRLKMIDKDGAVTFSNIIALRRDGYNSNTITVTPNPVVNGIANISVTASSGGFMNVGIHDGTGKLVQQQQARVSPGVNNITLSSTQHLQPGIYMLRTEENGVVQTTRFIVGK